MFGTLISTAQALGSLDRGDCRFFDCSFDLANPGKGRQLYSAGHVPTAHYLHLDEDLSSVPTGRNGRHPLPEPQTLAARLRGAGLDADQQVIAYDNAGGAYAARLWWLLRWLGHDHVAVLDGGIQAWTSAGQPMQSGEAPPVKPGTFRAQALRTNAIVDAAVVVDNLERRKLLVLDARAADRFRGEASMLDAVAGHIPGARNRPFKANLDSNGFFKPPAALAADFVEVINGFSPPSVILQCGSGVTACHNALALEIAGMTGARLYPGSWSEWVADPARPVALGCVSS